MTKRFARQRGGIFSVMKKSLRPYIESFQCRSEAEQHRGSSVGEALALKDAEMEPNSCPC